jgi:hypothetical protein
MRRKLTRTHRWNRCLIQNRCSPDEPIWIVDPDQDPTLNIQDPGGLWSEELKAMIRICLNYFPVDRPTFDDLLDIIDTATRGQADLSLGMKDGSALVGIRAAHMPRFGNESYRIGLVRPEPRVYQYR